MEQYNIYTDPITGAIWRDGVRSGLYIIDKVLTATGFAGTENVDWENVFSLD